LRRSSKFRGATFWPRPPFAHWGVYMIVNSTLIPFLLAYVTARSNSFQS